jgi:hypothetical protein
MRRGSCDAGDSRDVCVALEALSAGGLPDQDRGTERAAADLGRQLRAMCADEVARLALERLRFTSHRDDPFDLFPCDPNSRRLRIVRRRRVMRLSCPG